MVQPFVFRGLLASPPFRLFDGSVWPSSRGCGQQWSICTTGDLLRGAPCILEPSRVAACWDYGSLSAQGAPEVLFHICPKVHPCLQPLAFPMRGSWLAFSMMACTHNHNCLTPFHKRGETGICAFLQCADVLIIFRRNSLKFLVCK